MPPPARKPLPSFFGLLYANSCKSAVPTVYYAIFAIYEPLLCVAGMIGAFFDPVKVCIPNVLSWTPPAASQIDVLNFTSDSQHERPLAGRCYATRSSTSSDHCNRPPAGPHMCFTRDYQLVRPHRNQGTSVSRIAGEDGHVIIHPSARVGHLAHVSDAIRDRRHEVEYR